MDTTKKHISIITPCYNEEGNVDNLVQKIAAIFSATPQYTYEHVFIDNGSTDKTLEILRRAARENKVVKVIANTRNFGSLRSSFYGMLQCKGDAVISIVADFQDPPEMIGQFLAKWEEGYPIVIGVKNKSEENRGMFALRKAFYNVLSKMSSGGESPVKNFTGFGLYDQKFISVLRTLDDPDPYFRGMITELGYDRYEIEYTQPRRASGTSKNDFFALYDVAVLGFTSHSRMPMRLSAMLGFCSAIVSLLVGLVFFIYKLVFWHTYQLGHIPLVIGLFLFSSVQLFFIGIIGEYIGAIHTQVRKRPLVIEKERINFD